MDENLQIPNTVLIFDAIRTRQFLSSPQVRDSRMTVNDSGQLIGKALMPN